MRPGKFFLVVVPRLVGAVLRLPCTFAVVRFGGRNWMIVSALLLLIPTILAAFVLQPGTPYGVFILVADQPDAGVQGCARSASIRPDRSRSQTIRTDHPA